MKNKVPTITALIALAGVALGGRMQYLSSRTLEFEKASLKYCRIAYRDFLAAPICTPEGESQTVSIVADRKVRDATLRISIFGPKKVAAAVAEQVLAQPRKAPQGLDLYIKGYIHLSRYAGTSI